jgi:hypothetical protein
MFNNTVAEAITVYTEGHNTAIHYADEAKLTSLGKNVIRCRRHPDIQRGWLVTSISFQFLECVSVALQL